MFPARIPIISQPPVAVSLRDGVTNDYSLEFDGTDDSVTMANFPALGDTFSVSAWVKWDSIPTAVNYDYIISFGAAGTRTAFAIATHGADDSDLNKLRCWASSEILMGTTVMTAGSWIHVVMVAKPTSDRLKLYINGVEDTIEQPSGDFNIASTSTAMMGRWHLGAYSFIAGYIDEVAVFDTNLTADDVEDIYNGGTPTDLASSDSYDTDRTGNLVRYWRMTEGSGNTCANAAGTGDYKGSISFPSTGWSSETAPN